MTHSEQILSLQSENRQLKAPISELPIRIVGLATLVLKPSKDSKNSGKPPSTHTNSKNQRLKPTGDKSSGGQQGHKNHALKVGKMSDWTDRPIPDYCNFCDKSPGSSTCEPVSRRQAIDMLPIVPVTIGYQCCVAQRACGACQSTKFPQALFDTNSSARASKMVEVKTKISGSLKSLQHELAVIRFVIDAAQKTGQFVFNAITALVNSPLLQNAAG